MSIFAKSFTPYGNSKVIDMGATYASNGSSRPMMANAKFTPLDKEGPGKKFYIDFAIVRCRPGTNIYDSKFFDIAKYTTAMNIKIFNINGGVRDLDKIKKNGVWENQKSDGWFSLGTIKPPCLVQTQCWTRQHPRPRYGLVDSGYNGVDPRQKGISLNVNDTAETTDIKLDRAGVARYHPSSLRVGTHFAGEPVGVRYLSNNGWVRT